MNKPLFLAALVLLLTATGCQSLLSRQSDLDKAPTQTVAVPYHEHSLQNFQLARTYVTQGRYELAKERYLLALSSSRNDELRQRVIEELESVDLLIKTQR